VAADVSRADAVERVAGAADRVRDLERDTRRARSRLHLVIAEAVNQHPAEIPAGKATADA
jgi:hypothetical protein